MRHPQVLNRQNRCTESLPRMGETTCEGNVPRKASSLSSPLQGNSLKQSRVVESAFWKVLGTVLPAWWPIRDPASYPQIQARP